MGHENNIPTSNREALLPCRPKPLHDELLSSWLIRVAHGNGMKLQSFCHMMWPGRAIWNRDCDRCADAELVTSLAEITGTPLRRAQQTLLSAFSGSLFRALVRTGNTPWMMPLGVHHRIRHRHGLQYCPQCLANGEPYFRRSWRLSLYTVCPEHRRTLLDGCPHCSQPVHPHRAEMGDCRRQQPLPRTICSYCRCDLCDVEPRGAVPRRLLQFQRLHARIMEHTLPGDYDPVDYFNVLAQILQVLASPRELVRHFRSIVAEGAGVPLTTAPPDRSGIGLYFDVMGPERMRLLESASWLLEDWPDRFVNICKIARVRGSDLVRDLNPPPGWFMLAIRLGCYPRSWRALGDIDSIVVPR